MADTIDDVILTGTAYQDVYAATSISVGTELILQNKSKNLMFVQISASQPTATSVNGFILLPYTEGRLASTAQIDAGETGCWIIGTGPLGVQEG